MSTLCVNLAVVGVSCALACAMLLCIALNIGCGSDFARAIGSISGAHIFKNGV
jgi:hypothetical protein